MHCRCYLCNCQFQKKDIDLNKNSEQNAAFNRCIDVMTRLIEKYGPAVLEEERKADEPFALPHHKRPGNMKLKYLQSYYKYLCLHKKERRSLIKFGK